MPNWYRWTMVVILTLLLTACQSAIPAIDGDTDDRWTPLLNAPQNAAPEAGHPTQTLPLPLGRHGSPTRGIRVVSPALTAAEFASARQNSHGLATIEEASPATTESPIGTSTPSEGQEFEAELPPVITRAALAAPPTSRRRAAPIVTAPIRTAPIVAAPAAAAPAAAASAAEVSTRLADESRSSGNGEGSNVELPVGVAPVALGGVWEDSTLVAATIPEPDSSLAVQQPVQEPDPSLEPPSVARSAYEQSLDDLGVAADFPQPAPPGGFTYPVDDTIAAGNSSESFAGEIAIDNAADYPGTCAECTPSAPCRRHAGRLIRALTPRRFAHGAHAAPVIQVPTMVAAPAPVPDQPQRPLSQLYPDEYICDGGDDLYDVQVNRDWTVRGLDPEDTVGHFDTLDGRVVVEPSNQVCIYAPRFAAVRQVKSAFEDTTALALVAANQGLNVTVGRAQDRSIAFESRAFAKQGLMIQPAVTFRDRLPASEAVSPLALTELTRDFKAHEDFRVMEFGIHRASEKALVERYAEAAIVWTHEKAVQVMLENEMALARVAVDGPDIIYRVGQQGSPKLRVIKTASTGDALPGEIIDFTLRFDNVGSQVIGNVTLIDNLTTRLDYLDKSAQCSRTAKFFKDENEVDSLTLRWEIDEPLEPGEGGLIRFRCRVR